MTKTDKQSRYPKQYRSRRYELSEEQYGKYQEREKPRGMEDVEDHDTKRQGRETKKKEIVVGPDPQPRTPPWLREVVREMGGDGERLLLQKKLTKTDVDSNQNRLSMMVRQLRGEDDFLTEEEGVAVLRREEDSKHFKGLDVTFVESRSMRSELSLRKWEIGSSISYVLIGNWYNIVERNNLKDKYDVQIWFFRCKNRKPCFALVNVAAETASSSAVPKGN